MGDDWVATRWWRVVLDDGTLWCQTSDETQAWKAIVPGSRIERMYERTEYVWRAMGPDVTR